MFLIVVIYYILYILLKIFYPYPKGTRGIYYGKFNRIQPTGFIKYGQQSSKYGSVAD